ncbi:MAG: DNA gyrase subunit B [Clostridia bacterium]|nr:DNA gyrase subunit B [Clostridia bacterium]
MAAKQTYDESSIEVLEGLEPVRRRPGMYIGSTGTKGLNHLIYEIVDNSVDEHLAGYCSEIYVTLHPDGSCTVRDNGRGIPVGLHPKKKEPAVRVVLTTLHAGGKFGDGAYKTSGGLHGVGSSAVNALSAWMDVEVSQGGQIHHDHYQQGKPTIKLKKEELLPVIGKTKATGTKISFLPDPEIFERTRFRESDIKARLHEITYLNPGLAIHYKDEREDGQEPREMTFLEEGGITKFVQDINAKEHALHEPIYFRGSSDDIEVECAIQYTDDFHENTLGFCNTIYNSEGGTHITGFKTALTIILNQYARAIGVLKEKDDNFSGGDVRTGLTAIVSVKHRDPRFEGQTKTKLDNPDAAKAVTKVTQEQLTLFFDRNLETLKTILGCAEKAARIRKAEEKSRQNLLTKKRFSFDSNGKLANCISRDAKKCEIFIVEGDSAGGSAKTARDRNYQAILPLRGKILNIEKASIDKVLANEEIRTMIYAFGCGFSEGYGNDFDIEKLKYDKIIIMTDADVDGAHIDTLALTLFYRLMPELITEGHVYLAMPPLYKAVPKHGGEEQYLYDDQALEQYRRAHKDGSFTLQRYKGLGEMDYNQLWETTMDPRTRVLKRVSIEDAALASETTAVLMGNDVAVRKDFIYENANMAELDI